MRRLRRRQRRPRPRTPDGRTLPEFPDSTTAAKAFAPLAEGLLPARAPGDHNQAMMELGATVCLRRKPLCLLCPVKSFCAGAKRGDPESYPRLAPKPSVRQTVTRVWCENRGALLLHRASAGSRRLASLHELPTPEQAGIAPEAAQRGPHPARKRRSITRFQIIESIHAAPKPRGRLAEGLAWVPLADLEGIALSGPHRRWVREILADH